ncbi:hypothetical protein [Ramlibacter alkalitolerans]|uniref:Uncharacterized protein n=1 Tax=Ramlibacter alkalitolerans TaxID=2039631 RepID=A0ABS1JN55_9BURK|nr:hypothetical protein [Ramlibacter alkalitolerans]MBL0425576.1 hypothetical protein [Ramlibacter alkalitolerans]
MNEQAMKAFLNQFAASRSDFDSWPAWMKQSAKVAGATFPKAHPAQDRASPAEQPLNEPPKEK